MITDTAQDRLRILIFWKKHGNLAAKEAFNVSRATLFCWQKDFKNVAPLSLTHAQTDNGSEFENHFEIYCEKENITHFHAYPRTPKMQSEIERFNRTLSEVFIKHNRHLLVYNIEEFNIKLMDWLLLCNTRRPHLVYWPYFSIEVYY